MSEYLVDRMLAAGVDRLAIVISPGKSDIMEYYGAEVRGAGICYLVQPSPIGLCDAIFRALPLIRPEDRVVVGLPDTLWFPEDALARLPDDGLSFLLFPVEHPELFDAVITDEDGAVREIQAKQRDARSRWIWGAFKLGGRELQALSGLFHERGRLDTYMGPLVNEYLARGGRARAVRAGESYVDVGTVRGYREAVRLLGGGRE